MKKDSFCARFYVADQLDKISQTVCRKERGYEKCCLCPYYENFDKCMEKLDKVVDRMWDTFKWWKRK